MTSAAVSTDQSRIEDMLFLISMCRIILSSKLAIMHILEVAARVEGIVEE